MKKFAKFLSVAFLFFSLGTAAFSQTATADASAVVVTPLTLNYNAVPLDFGSLATGVAGTVVLTAAGARSSATVTLLNTTLPTAAQFTLSGNPTSTYGVTFEAGVVINNGGGTADDNMSIDTFTHDASGTIPGAGNEVFHVGGTLHVSATQNTGTYTGTFDVTVSYN